MSTPRIVLTMIVRNEAKIIARCIESALPILDGYVIVDTGSTDDTRSEIARAVGDLPGLVSTDVWTDFGTNRTRSASLATQWASEKHWDLDSTYLLLLDADMVLRITDGFTKAQLTRACYRIPQVDPTLRYYNTRLVRLSHRWESVGVTHEYWAPRPDTTDLENVDWLWIQDLGDGGSKGNKTERDIGMLRAGLDQEPANGRYMFYLGQSLFDAASHSESEWRGAEADMRAAMATGDDALTSDKYAQASAARGRAVERLTEAIDWYQKRITAGGWDEEVWYAAYKRGVALLRLGKVALDPAQRQAATEQGAGALLGAYERRPRRAETLVALATHYREHGQNHSAYTMARQALDLPYPAGDTLFVDEPVNQRGALEEIAITGYYVGKQPEALAACETLLGMRGLHDWFQNHIACCASFYVRPIGWQAVASGSLTVSEALRRKPERFFGLADENQTLYECSNPTLARAADGSVYVNVRLVNYYHERGRVFAPKDPDGIVRTRNVIERWDPATGLALSEAESACELPAEWDHTTRVRGLEDQRWALHDGRIWVTFTCFNIPGAHQGGACPRCQAPIPPAIRNCPACSAPIGGMPRVALGRVTEALDGIEHVRELSYDGTRVYEKNWLPWSRDAGPLSLIYGYHPFVVLRVDTETGVCTPESATVPDWDTSRWRGSAAPVPSPGGEGKWIGLIHETAWHGQANSPPQDQRTVYMHRWFECTADRLTRRSPLFTFDHAGVEYAPGLLVDGTDLIVTHSVEESSAHWKRFRWETVDRMLNGRIDP